MAWNTGILNDGVNVMESVTPDPDPDPDPFSITITHHSDGSETLIPEGDPIPLPGEHLYVFFTTDSETPLDENGVSVLSLVDAQWYGPEQISTDVPTAGSNAFAWAIAPILGTITEFPQTFEITYKFFRGADEVEVTDTIILTTGA